MIAFTNANVISGGKILANHNVLVDDGKIVCITIANPNKAATVIDVDGQYLSAGLIDLHIHGGMGHDFMDGSKEAFEGIAAHHSQHGITSMLATTLAGDDTETFAFLDAYERYANIVTSCRFLGVHLEGPYFSLNQCGAQDPKFLRNPSPDHYKRLLSYGNIRRVSAAPELDGGLKLGKYLEEHNIIASMAHTDADYEQTLQAIARGYSVVTHLYSGMTGVHRRKAYRFGGLVEAALLLDTLTTEIIADNRHLPECLLKLIYKCKGKDGIILTSDAMRGAGLPNGQITKLGSLALGQDVIIEDDVAKLLDRSAFAGSVASGDRLIRTMVQIAGLPLVEAIGMMTINPARLLKLSDRIGDVQEGMEADLIVFDEDINVSHVMVAGQNLPIKNT